MTFISGFASWHVALGMGKEALSIKRRLWALMRGVGGVAIKGDLGP